MLDGGNLGDHGLKDTPARMIRAYREYFAGYETDPEEALRTTFRETDEVKEPAAKRLFRVSLIYMFALFAAQTNELLALVNRPFWVVAATATSSTPTGRRRPVPTTLPSLLGSPGDRFR